MRLVCVTKPQAALFFDSFDSSAALDDLPRLGGRLGKADQVQVFVGDRPLVGKELKIDRLLPVFATEQDDGDRLHAPGLAERQGVEQFVERAEALNRKWSFRMAK